MLWTVGWTAGWCLSGLLAVPYAVALALPMYSLSFLACRWRARPSSVWTRVVVYIADREDPQSRLVSWTRRRPALALLSSRFPLPLLSLKIIIRGCVFGSPDLARANLATPEQWPLSSAPSLAAAVSAARRPMSVVFLYTIT